jgi:hypothetical protein
MRWSCAPTATVLSLSCGLPPAVHKGGSVLPTAVCIPCTCEQVTCWGSISAELSMFLNVVLKQGVSDKQVTSPNGNPLGARVLRWSDGIGEVTSLGKRRRWGSARQFRSTIKKLLAQYEVLVEYFARVPHSKCKQICEWFNATIFTSNIVSARSACGAVNRRMDVHCQVNKRQVCKVGNSFVWIIRFVILVDMQQK